MSRTRTPLIIKLQRLDDDAVSGYESDVIRWKIPIPAQRGGIGIAPGIYWAPNEANHGINIDPSERSGAIRISYDPARPLGSRISQAVFPSTNSTMGQFGNSMVPIRAMNSQWSSGQLAFGAGPEALTSDRQRRVPLAWSNKTPQLYTALAEFASWVDMTSFEQPNSNTKSVCSRLAIDTGSNELWVLGKNYMQLVPGTNGELHATPWKEQDIARCWKKHKRVRLEIDSGPQKNGRQDGHTIISTGVGVVGYADETVAGLSYFRNSLRFYGLKIMQTGLYETLPVGKVNVGVAYALDRIAARRDYDGILGLNRGRGQNRRMFITSSLRENDRIQEECFYVRFLPEEDYTRHIYSFISFGGWPPKATCFPNFKPVQLVRPEIHFWCVHLEAMELTTPDNVTIRTIIGQDMILDTGSSFSYVADTTLDRMIQAYSDTEFTTNDKGLRTRRQLHLHPKFASTKWCNLIFRSGTERVRIRAHPSRFLTANYEVPNLEYGNSTFHERASDTLGILGINFFQSVFVGFAEGEPGAPAHVKLASFKSVQSRDFSIPE